MALENGFDPITIHLICKNKNISNHYRRLNVWSNSNVFKQNGVFIFIGSSRR